MCGILAHKWFRNMSSFPFVKSMTVRIQALAGSLTMFPPPLFLQFRYLKRNTLRLQPRRGRPRMSFVTSAASPLVLVCGGGELQMYGRWEVNGQTQKVWRWWKMCMRDSCDCRVNKNLILVFTFTVRMNLHGGWTK